ncbi:BrnA antitoxin family protein [Nostoc sp. C052]|nr:BrnA antitoxin family protein [Nostoc sp. C052]
MIESTPTGKTRITIRVDDEVLAWFRDQVHTARKLPNIG